MEILWIALLGSWIYFLLQAFKGISHLKTLKSLSPSTTVESTLSIIIAVKDDAPNIQATLDRLLMLSSHHLEIIVVNDRSKDTTQSVIEAAIRKAPHLKCVQVKSLPTGWLGKVHALSCGYQQARGEFILFMDADVRLTDLALMRSLGICQEQRLDHLTILPWIPCKSYFLELLMVTSEILFTLSFRPWLKVSERPYHCAKGIGAFNLVRNSFFKQTPGFDWLKMDISDDVALAQLIAQHGGRSLFVKASPKSPEITWNWYKRFSDMFYGLEKNTVGGFTNYRWPLMLTMPTLSLMCFLLPSVGLYFKNPYSYFFFGSTLVFATFAKAKLHRRLSVIAALPLGLALLGIILIRSTYLCFKNRGIWWCGTFYPLAGLKQGIRVRLRP